MRLACDCLGPRGDDKNGCRDVWETYCLMRRRSSAVTSYHSNRFNNFFQAAAALHFHRQDIQDCLGNFMGKKNRKLESILEDNRSDDIDCHIVALGLLYYRVTGPYWQLLGRGMHYLDFYSYITMLRQFLLRWEESAGDAFALDFEPLFGAVFMPNPDIFQSLVAISPEKQEKVKQMLQQICKGMVTVTERQLKDFLPGGRYHAVQDPDLRQKMIHSKMTNLVGEQCFGDLDFSLFKRRNASLHHHSSINMMKRNKTASSWLFQKDAVTQLQLLDAAKKQAPALRKKHMAEEKDAVAARMGILEENRQRKVDAENKRRDKIQGVMALLQPHNGPCSSPEDVNALLRHYATKKSQLLAIKGELLYQKLVLHLASPLLRVTGNLQQLSVNLKVFLGADAATAAAEPLPQPLRRRRQRAPVPQPAEEPVQRHNRKRRRVSSDSDSESESEADVSEESVSDIETEMDNDDELAEFTFTFQRTAQLIAVYYDGEFYIGEVTQVLSDDEGEVNFMSRCTIKSNTFRWPNTEDRDTVNRKFVFVSDVQLEPASTTRGTWNVSNMDDIEARFRLFVALFC